MEDAWLFTDKTELWPKGLRTLPFGKTGQEKFLLSALAYKCHVLSVPPFCPTLCSYLTLSQVPCL